MAYPEKPMIDYSYTAHAQAQGDASFPGFQLDNDLFNLKTSVDSLNHFVRGVTRSDGKLGNGTVGREQLAADITLGFNAPATWSAGTAYAVPDTVFFGGGFYVCLIAHTASESFQTDLNANRWEVLVDFLDEYYSKVEADALFATGASIGALFSGGDYTTGALAQASGGTGAASLGDGLVTASGGATPRSLAAHLAWRISVADFGATGDGVTNDTAAIQAAIDAAEAAGGGVVYLPNGQYAVTTLTIDGEGVCLEGDGAGNMIYPTTGAFTTYSDAPTRLIGTATTGPVIRIKAENCGVRNIKVDASAARAAAAYGAGHAGIRIEAEDDTSSLTNVALCYVERVRVLRQPGPGVQMIGEVTGSALRSVVSSGNKGHGFVVERGESLSVTNEIGPGIVSLYDCRASDNGGNAVALGHPDDDENEQLPAYRVIAFNFECFRNASDAAARHVDYEVYMRGDNCAFYNSAFGGSNSLGPEDHGGVYVVGRGNRLIDCRYIDTTQPVEIANDTKISYGNVVDGMSIRNPTITHAVAVLIGANVEGTTVRIMDSSGWAAAASPDRPDTTVVSPGVEFRRAKMTASALASGDARTVADNAAESWQLDAPINGGLIAISTTSGRGAVVFVRTESAAACVVVAGAGGTWAATTGVLAGTTGADAAITISAHTDNRIYIENRSGTQIGVAITLLSTLGGGKLADTA